MNKKVISAVCMFIIALILKIGIFSVLLFVSSAVIFFGEGIKEFKKARKLLNET